MTDSVQQLTVRAVLSGDGAVVRGLQRIGSTAATAMGSAARYGKRSFAAWTDQVKAAGTQIRGLAGEMSRMMALPALIGGAFGAGKLLSEVVDYDKAMTSFRIATGASGKEIDGLNSKLAALAGTLGMTKAQMLGMVRTGMDFGLTLQEAQDAVSGAWSMGQTWEVDPAEIMQSVALAKRAMNLSPTQALGWMSQSQKRSGVNEKEFAGMLPMLLRGGGANLRGAGPEAASFVSALIAGLGGEGFRSGRATTGALLGTVEMLTGTPDAKTGGIFKAAGINASDDLAVKFRKLAEAVHRGGKDIEGLDSGVVDLIGSIDASKMAAFNEALGGTAADFEKAGKDVEAQAGEHAQGFGVQFNALIEQIKAPMLGGLKSFLDWLVTNKEPLIGAFNVFKDGLLGASGLLRDMLQDLGLLAKDPSKETEKVEAGKRGFLDDVIAAPAGSSERAKRLGRYVYEATYANAGRGDRSGADETVRDRMILEPLRQGNLSAESAQIALQASGMSPAVAAALVRLNETLSRGSRVVVNVDPSLGAQVRVLNNGEQVDTLDGA